jgi:hypothetical protein
LSDDAAAQGEGDEGAFGLCTPTMGAVNAPYVDPEPVLFDPLRPVEIELEIDAAGLEALRASPRDYVRAGFRLLRGDESFGPLTVGVALKGNEAGTFRPIDERAAFKIRFDEFDAGQRFLGLKGLKLGNLIEDPSLTHEALGYALFEAMGVPAARAGYAVVRVNGADYGLRSAIERLDGTWASRHFRSTAHVYEAGVLALDVTPGREGELDIDEGSGDRSDLEALTAVSVAPDGAFTAALEAVAPVDELARMWLLSQYIAHWDGYAGGTNNYYLHSDEQGRFHMVPSGIDQSFEQLPYDLKEGASLFAPQGVLFSRCTETPACDAVLDAAWGRLALDLAAFDAVGLFDGIVSAIEPLVQRDTRLEVDVATVHERQAATRRFLVERSSILPQEP